MKSSILTQLSTLPYFTVTAVEQLNNCSAQTARQLASRWEKQGKIIRLKQGYYITRDFYLSNRSQLGFTEMISAIIQPFSYLSLEYILQKHQILSEAVYVITAVTAKNTQHINNQAGRFSYRHLKPKLFTGFTENYYLGVNYKEASKSKALFDYFYFRPTPAAVTTPNFSLAADLRLNLDDWTKTEVNEFAKYIQLSASPKMKAIYKNLVRNICH